MYDVSAQGVYERMMNGYYYYYSYALSLFAPELSRKRYWRGQQSWEVGGQRETIPN